jgi:putative transposase
VTAALHQLVRDGATRLCALALEAELREFLDAHSSVLLPDGSRACVRNGYLPERTLLTDVGEIPVKVPRTRDRGNVGMSFTSALLPPYHSRVRRDADLAEAWLRAYIEADALRLLRILFGPQVGVLAEPVLKRINSRWKSQVAAWRQQALTDVNYLCWWVGTAGGHALAPLLLFIVGMTQRGTHELVAASAVSAATIDHHNDWLDMLHGLRLRRLRNGPQLCEAEGLPGFREALHHYFPGPMSGLLHGAA